MSLVERIAEVAANPPRYYETMCFSSDWRERIADPRFDEAGRVHDWRNHVHWLAAEHWHELDEAARLLIYLQALEGAREEKWE